MVPCFDLTPPAREANDILKAELSQPSQELSQLIRQIEDRVSIEVEAAGFRSRRTLGEELNQMMRRLRQCGSTEQAATWILDSAASFGRPAALFEVARARRRVVRSRR